MATDLGKVGMVMKGAYNSANTYEVLDSVSYQGGLYIAKREVPAGTAPTNTTYWQDAVSWLGAKVDISSAFTTPTEDSICSSISAMAYLTGNLVEYSISGYCNATTPKGKNICDISEAYKPGANRLATGIIIANASQDASTIYPIYYSLDKTNSKFRFPSQGGLNMSVTAASRLVINGSYYL